MIELDFAWKQMIDQEFLVAKKNLINNIKQYVNNLESELPMSQYELSIKFEYVKNLINELN